MAGVGPSAAAQPSVNVGIGGAPASGAPPVGAPGFGGMDPFLSGVAGNMLRQQGQSYLQRGQAFMQVRCGLADGQACGGAAGWKGRLHCWAGVN